MKLLRTDIAPPGGFHVRGRTKVLFKGSSFTDVVTRFSEHLKANELEGDAEAMVEQQTAARLKREGHKEWLKETG